MNKIVKYGYVLSIVTFIIGLRIALTWSYSSRILGVFLVIVSLFVAYWCYQKTHTLSADSFRLNTKQTSLGFILIVIDLLYNIISQDAFKSFDYGMIFAGIIIILLNIGTFHFLKLNTTIISFSTYFIFITMILYGFLFSGLPFLLGDKNENFIFEWTTNSVVIISASLLNYILPTTTNGSVINFNGFNVGIGDPCSGVESITVFFSSAIAYIIATRQKNTKKMAKYMLIGGVILYIINIVRVLVIIWVGYYMGLDKMLFVHYNLGWIFFVVGMAVFWYLVIGDSEDAF